MLISNIISACRPIHTGNFDPIITLLASYYLSADLYLTQIYVLLLLLLLCFYHSVAGFFSFYFTTNFIIIGEMCAVLLTGFGSFVLLRIFSSPFWVREFLVLHRIFSSPCWVREFFSPQDFFVSLLGSGGFSSSSGFFRLLAGSPVFTMASEWKFYFRLFGPNI